jgi:hypothetical protein
VVFLADVTVIKCQCIVERETEEVVFDVFALSVVRLYT